MVNVNVSSKDIRRFNRLEFTLIKNIHKKLKKEGFTKIQTFNKEEYLSQDLFDLSLPLKKNSFLVLCDETGTLQDESFFYFIGKSMPEFKIMSQLLKKYGTDIYTYLEIC